MGTWTRNQLASTKVTSIRLAIQILASITTDLQASSQRITRNSSASLQVPKWIALKQQTVGFSGTSGLKMGTPLNGITSWVSGRVGFPKTLARGNLFACLWRVVSTRRSQTPVQRFAMAVLSASEGLSI